MMAEWKKYTGSDEQIGEIQKAFIEKGFLVRNSGGISAPITQGKLPLTEDFVKYHFKEIWKVAEYLICNPHPRADMICQQARTGQEVYIKGTGDLPEASLMPGCRLTLYSNYWVIVTNEPNWYLNAEYSFTEFKD